LDCPAKGLWLIFSGNPKKRGHSAKNKLGAIDCIDIFFDLVLALPMKIIAFLGGQRQMGNPFDVGWFSRYFAG
jgi:hypothetical protein